MTLVAQWTVAPTPPPTTTVTITFNTGSGTMPSGVAGVRHGEFGFRVDNLPTPIAPAGYTFIGWFVDGMQIVGPFAATHNVTLHAHFQRTTVGPTMFTLTFVLNQGQMPANVGTTQTHADGTLITSLPVPTRAGHVFAGWVLQGTNNIQQAPFNIRNHMTLAATWATTATPTPTPQPTIPPGHLVVAFDAGTGASFPANERGIRTGVYGFVINTAPIPTRPGHTFVGWSIGTTPITFPFTVRQDTTMTARWTPIGGVINPQTSPLQLTFTIFGAVLLVGVAAFGIMKLTGKQLATLGQYRTNMTRFNREKRITEMFEKRGPKNKK